MSTFRKLQVQKLTADFLAATKVVKVPLVSPATGQVRVKNCFAGVNASDVNITAGRYFTDGKVPFDVGFEGCGVVDQVSSGASDFEVGQPVLYFGGSGYAEYIYAQPQELVPIPEVNPKFIAALVTGLTAAIGLDIAGQIKSTDKVLITAAAGGTGQICVQWAKKKGCHVIGTTSSDSKAAFLKTIGCDDVINYKKEDLYERLSKSYPSGVDVIWETVGGEMFEKLLQKHLATHGRMVIVGGITGYKSEGIPGINTTNLPTRLLMRSQTLVGFLLTNERGRYKEYIEKLIRAVHSGELQVKLDNGETVPEGPFKGIDSVIRGVDYLLSGKNEGKVVIDLNNR